MTPITAATLAALVGLLLAGGLYAAVCWVMPFTGCRRCEGTGYRISGRLGEKVRPCRRCRSTGTHLRAGRQLYNYASRVHAEATTTTMPPQRDPKQPPNRPHW